MKYVFYDTEHNQMIGEAKDIRRALELFEDTTNVLDPESISCMVFEDNADIEHDQPDQLLTGEQFKKRAQYLGAGSTVPVLNKVDPVDNSNIKPVSQDRAGILKNLSQEEQAYVIGRVADQMLIDELNKRINTYNSTLDKILGNIKGLEVRI